MAVNVVKDKGMTVITVTSDSQSMFPPLCQIIKSLCYSPVCCSVHKGLMQTSVVSALGAVQIMVGLFNIGVGPGRTSHHPEDFAHLGVAYWLGGVFIAAGLMSVLAGRFPSYCSVCFAVFLNIVGSVFAIVGIVMYAIDLGDVSFQSMCDWSSYRSRSYDDNCRYVAFYAQRMLTAMDINMIILAALHLCVSISFAVLGIKALNRKKAEQVDEEVKIYQPVPTKVLMTSPGA